MTDISVVCPVHNPGEELLETVASIKVQSGVSLEVLLVSGGTILDVAEQAEQQIAEIARVRHIRHQESGISDAFNAGVTRSCGQYLSFLGSGDTFNDPDTCRFAIDTARSTDAVFVIGQVSRVHPGQSTPFQVGPSSFEWHDLKHRMAIPHQSLFTRREYFQTYGLFDSTYRYAMDYEHILRSFHSQPRYVFVPRVLSTWVSGGIGANDALGVLREYHRARSAHGVGTPIERIATHVTAVAKHLAKAKLVEPLLGNRA